MISFSFHGQLTKSLLLRSHPTFKEFAAHLIDLFEDEVLGLTAAKGFFVILDETEDVLNLASHADVKLMYRQRFFLYLLPNIIDGHGKTTPGKSFISIINLIINVLFKSENLIWGLFFHSRKENKLSPSPLQSPSFRPSSSPAQ